MPMLKDERQYQIVRQLHEKDEEISVNDLCHLLEVSPATVRRDIDELNAKGVVRKTHGGVVLPDNREFDPPVLQRRYLQAEEKHHIAREAAKLVKNGETIFLGNGSTVLEVAERLREKKNLTVITNSLPIINLLVEHENINIITTGGFVRRPELSLIGHFVESSLKDLRADKVIMSFQGIHIQHGLTNNSVIETKTDQAICKLSSQIIAVSDYTKCNRTRASFVADLEQINVLITDSQTPLDFVEELRNMGIDVIIADENDGHQNDNNGKNERNT
ncbi:MAG: DeoR/GlpR transcriptional regulator [Deltaproteobacteria bacterium]|nr:DeoR/GlpR transcriptional regulator [Deltaproteobacteria bacterium]